MEIGLRTGMVLSVHYGSVASSTGLTRNVCSQTSDSDSESPNFKLDIGSDSTLILDGKAHKISNLLEILHLLSSFFQTD